MMQSMEAKLMECLVSFELIDLLGFARMLKVEGDYVKKALCSAAVATDDVANMQEWEDFVCAIVEKYSEANRKQKRELLKLAKQIVKDNKDEKIEANDEVNPPQE